MKGISEIVGRGELDGGGGAEVYRALRSLLCATCGAAISEGALFTRRRVKGIGLRIMPQCAKCAPFTLQAGGKEKSALLRALLAEEPSDSPGGARPPRRAAPDSAPQARAAESDVDEQVRRRLGPALKRSVRGRK